MGRPSDYTPELASEICLRLSDGLSLRTICDAEEMPDRSTVFRWLAVNAEFRDQYARARETQADVLAEEIIEIADRPKEEKGAVDRDRLKVDARKWYAGKLRPKVYGDKVQNEHTGKDGGPVVLEVVTGVSRSPTD